MYHLSLHSLSCHPSSACTAVHRLEAGAAFATDGALHLRYRLAGDMAGLRLPPPGPPAPADGLWQHTCCEAFVAAVNSAAYHEFNFSPSGQWAIYRFRDYRTRDSGYAPLGGLAVACHRLGDGFQLDAKVPAALLPAASAVHIGLTVVIEAADGRSSYWALAHVAARPDFHLRAGFALTLKVPSP